MAAGMTLTAGGRNLLAQALTGKTLTFTRAFVGTGDLGTRNPYNMTDLVARKLELPITAMRTSSVGTAEVTVEVTNNALTSGFFMKEYGLFAKVDGGTETLYSYCNKGNEAGYLEGFDGTNPIHFALSLITVVDQAQNITATVSADYSYVTATTLDSRIESLFADAGSTAGFYTYETHDERRFRPLSLADTKAAILGVTDTQSLVNRIERLEDAINQITLALNVQEIYPGASCYMAEDFSNPDTIDQYSAEVTSVVAGDDSIDCNPLGGLLPGSWYTLTDGVHSELVQVHTVNLENDIMRVILYETVQNTYSLTNCRLVRTTSTVSGGIASGSPVSRYTVWNPAMTWTGLAASASYSVSLNSSLSASDSFILTGNSSVNESGAFTLS